MTTMPTSMTRPIREVMLIDCPVISSAAKAPVSAKGTDAMTTIENFIDSNWTAMTTKTSQMAVSRANPIEENSSCIIRIVSPSASVTPSGKVTLLLMPLRMVLVSWVAETPVPTSPVTVTEYFPSVRLIVEGALP